MAYLIVDKCCDVIDILPAQREELDQYPGEWR
jgi:hypothetical protein